MAGKLELLRGPMRSNKTRSCGARALYSQRLIQGTPAPFDSPVKMPGDSYEPRCAKHFVLPGRPH